MTGPVRPETALYEPGVAVTAKFVEDGGREVVGYGPVSGIVLGVEDEVDAETGEKLGRLFRVVDFRSGGGEPPRLLIRRLKERELDLAGAAPATDRVLRNLRRRLHRLVYLRSQGRGRTVNPPTDSEELEVEAVIALLLRLEVGR